LTDLALQATQEEVPTEDPLMAYTGVQEGKVNIVGDHSISQSMKKILYEHVSYSKQLPR
jgi:hypothetical protein